jgi:hypothetical protein
MYLKGGTMEQKLNKAYVMKMYEHLEKASVKWPYIKYEYLYKYYKAIGRNYIYIKGITGLNGMLYGGCVIIDSAAKKEAKLHIREIIKKQIMEGMECTK